VSLKSPGNGGAITQGTGGSIHLGYTDNSGTPGATTTINTPRGRFAFAITNTAVTVTCSACAATSTVLVSLGSADTGITSVRTTPGAGSFVVTGIAAAAGTVVCDFVVVN
jgi:hypothetical protein